MKKILILSTLIFVLASCGDNNLNEVREINNEIIEEGNGEDIVSEEIEEIYISMAEVEKHKENGDCYTVLDSKVYDVSNFFGKHPGGDENLMKTCGIDSTELFNNKHGKSEKAKIKKEEFYIGKLK